MDKYLCFRVVLIQFRMSEKHLITLIYNLVYCVVFCEI